MGSNFSTIKIFAKRAKNGELKEINSVEAFHFSVGSVLGDGSIHKRDFTLDIEQRSLSYCLWKKSMCLQWKLLYHKPDFVFKQMFLFLIPSNIPLRAKTALKQKEIKGEMVMKKYRSFFFSSRALYSDPLWRSFFYEKVNFPTKSREYRKKIPVNIIDYFWGDLALAIFFFDDGWYDWQKETVRFATGEWTRPECELMVECLKINFNLESVVYPLTGEPHHIFVKKTHYPEFYRRVFPFYQQFLQAFPHYALNDAMKNKILPLP